MKLISRDELVGSLIGITVLLALRTLLLWAGIRE